MSIIQRFCVSKAAFCVLGAVVILTSGCQDGSGGVGLLIAPPPNIDGTVERIIVNTAEKRVDHESAQFSDIIAIKDKTIIVDFWAEWCGPCKMQSKELARLLAQDRDDVVVVKVNVDRESGLAQHFEVSAIPDMRIFRNEKPLRQLQGFYSADEIADKLP